MISIRSVRVRPGAWQVSWRTESGSSGTSTGATHREALERAGRRMRTLAEQLAESVGVR